MKVEIEKKWTGLRKSIKMSSFMGVKFFFKDKYFLLKYLRYSKVMGKNSGYYKIAREKFISFNTVTILLTLLNWHDAVLR